MSNIIGNRTGNVIIPYNATTKRTKALDVSSYLASSSYITSLSVTKATAMFYADSNGVWFMDLIAKYTGNLDTAAYHVITLLGITFDSTAQFYQPVIGVVDDASYAAAGGWLSYVSPGTNSIYISYGNTVTGENGRACYINLSGIRLSAEPTWASLGTTAAAAMEGVIAADVWIPPVSDGVSGIFPSLNTALDNVTATRLGLKQYISGTNYNGGISPTLTGTGTFSTTRAVFVPYQMQDSTWRLKFTLRGTRSAGAAGYITFNGTTFKAGAGWEQAVTSAQNDANSTAKSYAFTSPNSGDISYAFTANVSVIAFSGDVELNSKPTWAY